MFPALPPKPDHDALELAILDLSERDRTFEQLRERNADGPRFSFVDGPVTANKSLAVHTAWGRTLKDVFQRYKALQGFHQRYQNGFDGRETYVDAHGCTHPLLKPSEIASLSIVRGSLTAREIEEIRSHVTHTYEFLSKIPWGKQFRRVAHIAGSHHERLNGTGYPHRLHAAEIPLQSKMMSVADIFDALTASDRPYKKAVPLEKALDILGFEVKDQHIDADLVRIFTEAQVWSGILPGT